MRNVYRNPFARHTILAERIVARGRTCTECGNVRHSRAGDFLYRFVVDPDSGPTVNVADGKLFCCRGCAESYTGQSFKD
jgi:hypothetical protein